LSTLSLPRKACRSLRSTALSYTPTRNTKTDCPRTGEDSIPRHFILGDSRCLQKNTSRSKTSRYSSACY
jgi:hypothetical protein